MLLAPALKSTVGGGIAARGPFTGRRSPALALMEVVNGLCPRRLISTLCRPGSTRKENVPSGRTVSMVLSSTLIVAPAVDVIIRYGLTGFTTAASADLASANAT